MDLNTDDQNSGTKQEHPLIRALEWVFYVIILSYSPSIGKFLLSLIFVVNAESPEPQNAIITLNTGCNFCLYLTSSALLDLKYFKKRDKIPNKIKGTIASAYFVSAIIIALKKMGVSQVVENPLIFIGAVALISICVTLATKYYMFLHKD